MNTKLYTKYVDTQSGGLCGSMPRLPRDVWRDCHCDNKPRIDQRYRPVYSFQRGWRWNRRHIIEYLHRDCWGFIAGFFAYHCDDLIEIMGNKHFNDLLRETGAMGEFKRICAGLVDIYGTELTPNI